MEIIKKMSEGPDAWWMHSALIQHKVKAVTNYNLIANNNLGWVRLGRNTLKILIQSSIEARLHKCVIVRQYSNQKFTISNFRVENFKSSPTRTTHYWTSNIRLKKVAIVLFSPRARLFASVHILRIFMNVVVRAKAKIFSIPFCGEEKNSHDICLYSRCGCVEVQMHTNLITFEKSQFHFDTFLLFPSHPFHLLIGSRCGYGKSF